MTAPPIQRRPPRRFSRVCLVFGTLCLAVGVISFVLYSNLFDSTAFGRRAADSLGDPGVSTYVADIVTARVIHRKPDLIAFRPVLRSAAGTLVTSRAFRAVVERAAAVTHRTALAQTSQNVLLSLPDLHVLVREAMRHASPALAAKLPTSLDSTVARLADSRAAAIFLRVARAGRRLSIAWPIFFGLGLVLPAVSVWLSRDRRRSIANCGAALIVVGLLLVGLAGSHFMAGLWIHDPGKLAFLRGIWRAYLGDLARWGVLLAGFGVLVSAGAASLLDRADLVARFSALLRKAAAPPQARSRRFAWGVLLFVIGCAVVVYPNLALNSATVVMGIGVAYVGSREVFRVLIDAIEAVEQTSPTLRSESRRRRLRPILVGTIVVATSSVFWTWRNPVSAGVQLPAVLVCNGFRQLCDRRIDEVVFPAAHNAMSNQDVPGWMFPHHEAGMAQMLRDGIRALLFDVHYGFAGGARIKTDMSLEPTADAIRRAVGDEGYAAAMRIRDRLVGVDESKRGLYFCHGFCELGAYPVGPTLREIRDFVVANPDEVLILVIEDAVLPADLAAEFETAGLAAFVYTGSVLPPWPTLGQMIESGKRVLVFTESGRSGVPWLRPAFETFCETPYTFHKVEEFSCRPNRGGDVGSLFQMNHWIDTTPTPKPSNAVIVNEYAFLLARAEKCAAERGHLPNIVAVDFYRTGNLMDVVNRLNRVQFEGTTNSE